MQYNDHDHHERCANYKRCCDSWQVRFQKISVDANNDLVDRSSLLSGELSITDADAGEAFFNADTIAGTHGSLDDRCGRFLGYTLDNLDPAVQALVSGVTLTDTVTVIVIGRHDAGHRDHD